MSVNWTKNHSDTGILRKKEPKEKREELFVFGYSCKLFRDDGKAQHIDQGKHLIPWMGDETLKIDRYDARGALHHLVGLEAPPGGFDWRVELTKQEMDVEQLCDEERYRAMHTDEDEEEMYKEEELKRLHAAGYGQVGFNYETTADPGQAAAVTEVDEPFVAPEALKALLPEDLVLPSTEKLNAIIEKTSKFIASQGAQMEILLRAKQADNSQFDFLNKDSDLHPYYQALTKLVKNGQWPEKKEEPVAAIEDKPFEYEEYLHPSLASTVIEAAPSIPNIPYRWSSECDYSLLVSRVQGVGGGEGDVPPPPGTAPLPPLQAPPQPYAEKQPQVPHHHQNLPPHTFYAANPMYYTQPPPQHVTPQPPPSSLQPAPAPVVGVHPKQHVPKPMLTPAKSTGLNLMKHYASDTDSDSDSDTSSDSRDRDQPQTIKEPPEETKQVIDKMSTYVARNGDEFAEIVRAKNDPRFIFLEPTNEYHPFYLRMMKEKRGEVAGAKKSKKNIVPVSFSIKKQKEPDPVLPKPALPYESSSDEDPDKATEPNSETNQETNKINKQETNKVNNKDINNIHVPTAFVYKLEKQPNNSSVQIITNNVFPKFNIGPSPIMQSETKKMEQITQKTNYSVETVKNAEIQVDASLNKEQNNKEKQDSNKDKNKDVENIKDKEISSKEDKIEEYKEDKIKEKERNKDKDKYYKDEYYRKKDKYNKDRSRSRSRSKRVEKSPDRRRKEKSRVKKKSKRSREVDDGVIDLEEYDDEMIDLTGDNFDSKECETEADKQKQLERRRRAAEFLKRVGVDPAAAALPTSSLASALVDTLKKKEYEEKRRRKEKKRRSKYDNGDDGYHKKSKRKKYDDDDSSDHDRRKKKRKDKKHSSSKLKRSRRRSSSSSHTEEVMDPPLNVDLPSTLRDLRQASPIGDLRIPADNADTRDKSMSDEYDSEPETKLGEVRALREREKSKSKRVGGKSRSGRDDRQYSEGEWSSDSDSDSDSSVDRDGGGSGGDR